jgi:hypothetical protein
MPSCVDASALIDLKSFKFHLTVTVLKLKTCFIACLFMCTVLCLGIDWSNFYLECSYKTSLSFAVPFGSRLDK